MCHVSAFSLLPSEQFFLCVVSKGISANMLKASSKRRRTQAQIKEEKEAAAQKEIDDEAKNEEIHVLQQQVM